ncbi:MAG: hypothetical protein H7138_20120 [Myxococcales bacterium]|nr:hypothetical protein [Myxococcales bacterium]
MKYFCSVWLVMGLAYSAEAQTPAPAEPATAAFLEKRVPEELATEGVVLSRNQLGLKLEQVGDKWLVSLIDLGTDRVSASTKVDTLPPDREAAVAAMTHVVAELATQIVGHVERRPSTDAPPVPPVASTPDRAASEMAELKYKRQAIRFSTTMVVGNNTITPVQSGRGWRTYQGDLDEELKPRAFYKLMGRPDLVAGYDRRRNLMIGGAVVSGLGYATMIGLFATFPDVGSDSWSSYFTLTGVVFSVAFVSSWWTFYYYNRPQPIDVDDAKRLADAYNQGLRRQFGLPVAAREPLLRDLRLAPYVGGDSGGLVLAARF